MSQPPTLWHSSFTSISLANLLMAISFYFMLPILPIYMVDVLSATKGEVGLVLSFYTIAALAIRPFTGWAIDRFGRKWIYLVAYIIFALLFIGYPVSATVLLLITVRFAHGLTWGVLTTAGSTIAVDLIPPSRRGEGIGVFGLSMTLAMAIGPLLAIVITGEARYMLLFIVAIAICGVGFLFTLLVRYRDYTPEPSKVSLSIKSAIEPSSMPSSINIMLVMFSYGSMLSFIALYGIDIGVSNSGFFFILLALGIGLSRIGSGRITDRSGPKLVTIIGILMLVIGFPILALVQSSLGFHVSALLLGLGFGVVMATFQTMVNNLVTPQRRGAANSTLFTGFDLGIGIGMLITGFISQWIGLSGAFLVCAGINVGALLLFNGYVVGRYREELIK